MTYFEHIIVVLLSLDRLSVCYTCLSIYFYMWHIRDPVFSNYVYLYPQKQKDVLETVCRIPMITSANEEQQMIVTCRKVAYYLHFI